MNPIVRFEGLHMKAPWPVVLLTRREIVAVALTIALLLGLFSAQLYLGTHKLTGSALGPEWDCSNPGMGDSVCVKLPKKTETPP
jgi:hypothetical protein